VKKQLTLLCLVVFIISCRGDNTVELDSCIVTYVQGDVLIRDGAGERPLMVGDTVVSGQTISTSPNASCELQFSDRSVVRIKPMSTLGFEEMVLTSDNVNTRLDLKLGQVLVHSEELEDGSNFELTTETITTGIRGTQYSVTVTDDKSTLAVREGTVSVAKNLKIDQVDGSEALDDDSRNALQKAVTDGVPVTDGNKVEVSRDQRQEAQEQFSSEVQKVVSGAGGTELTPDEKASLQKSAVEGIESAPVSEEERAAILPDEEFDSMEVDRDILIKKERISVNATLNTSSTEVVMVYINDEFYTEAYKSIQILIDKSGTESIGFTAIGYKPKKIDMRDLVKGDNRQVSIEVNLEPANTSDKDVYRPKTDEEIKKEAEDIRDEAREVTDSLRSEEDSKMIRETEEKTDSAVDSMEKDIDNMNDPDYDAESDLENELSNMEDELKDL
jgi:hypothetical protein